jgi:hypothetical protein
MKEGKDYDYKVTVGMIKVMFPKNPSDPETDMDVRLLLLPAWAAGLPYHGQSSVSLRESLKEANIKDELLQGEICCSNFASFLKVDFHSDKPILELLREYDLKDDEDYTSKGRRVIGRQRTYYCPYCGKRTLFVWELLGTFKLSHMKKEVCASFFKLVK